MRLPVTRLAVVTLLLVVWLAPPTATAFGPEEMTPLAGLWCGMTEDGGSVRLTVTDDGRYVRDIEIRTLAGGIVKTEGFDDKPTQIKSGEFIWRAVRVEQNATQPGGTTPIRPGGPGRCIRVPCRPISAAPGGGGGGSNTTNVSVVVRGEFETLDYVDGSYTGVTTVSGTRPSTTRISGGYAAWPAALGGCPSR